MQQNYKAILLTVLLLLSFTIPPLAIILGIIFLTILLYDWYTGISISRINLSNLFNKQSTDSHKLQVFKYQKYNYLQSPEWKNKRASVILRDNSECLLCGTTDNLEVHHLSSYKDIPNEPDSSLVCLCRSCHQYQHDVHGYPQTYHDYMNWNVELV